MRINKFLKLSLVVLGAMISSQITFAANKKAAAKAVPNFTPGLYVLESSSKGATESCGEGDFRVVENGQNILLGPKHGFSLSTKMEKTAATDDPEEKGCTYENSNSYTVKDETTTLSSREILRCDGVERHSFTETALITKDRIHLEFKQVATQSPNPGDAAAEYKCDWTLSKRSAASIFMQKKAIEKVDKKNK